jgi:lipoprotein-anchoring transpeptidase ErfK/SrfK
MNREFTVAAANPTAQRNFAMPSRAPMARLIALAAVLASAGASAQGPSDLRANLAWQIALDRAGFSPGIIDGCAGRKTELATRELQRTLGLRPTGRLDPATAAALAVEPDKAVTTYTVQPADLAGIGPVPDDWYGKSRLTRLGYESVSAAVAERFQCTRGLLARLNPGCDLNRLASGDVLQVPAVSAAAGPSCSSLEINFAEKSIRGLDASGATVALFHCSIAKHRQKLPSGEASVAVISEDPTYTFDPKMWPEAKGVDRKLLIPPGPRNPVGRCWIGLDLPGYGIHGSPAPEMIGKTGSHGCFRLTNWDALRLARMIRVGTKVRFTGRPPAESVLAKNSSVRSGRR